MKTESVAAINSSGITLDTARKLTDNPVVQQPAGQEPQSQTQSQSQVGTQNSSVSKDEVEKAIKVLNVAFQKVKLESSYSIDKRTGLEVVKIENTETGEVVRQYPPEEILNMLHKMYDMWGIFLDKKV